MNISEIKSKHPKHWRNSSAIRILAADAVHAAASGHQGMPIGMADVATVLFQNHLKFDAKNPDWADRDRFILSAGHGSMLIYSLLHLTGYEDMTMEEIKNFRQWGAKTAGHPEYGHAKGIETTTGPLGQGISNAVGFAMAEQSLQSRYGKKIIDHCTYVIAGDGCLMEGVSQEAITLAGKQKLNKLIVMWDDNNISIDGEINISDVTDQQKRFESAGWSVFTINGHDPHEIDIALTNAKKSAKPSMIACKTTIAVGVEGVENTAGGHGYNIKDPQLAQMRELYEWPYPKYEIPTDVKEAWLKIGSKGSSAHNEWNERFLNLSKSKQADFNRVMNLETPKKLSAAIKRLKKEISENMPKMATRKSSQTALEVINPIMQETIGGSADLTGSNNTITKGMKWFDADNRDGRHVAYGIREHGMAAAMNGMVLHGGVRPYGGTFMCFTDYARPSMRLAALMKIPVVYVYTHDSIGLGEDGPTHQPVEHLAISRATPNTWVFRPADTVETAEAWELAVTTKTTPSVLSLTRQGLRTVRTKHTNKNMVSMGAYVLADAVAKRKVILIASGSEVEIALDAKIQLESEGIGTRVVSMPCMELFAEQDETYRRRVLPAGPVRVGIEAAVQQGWDRWLTGERGKHNKSAFIGMDSFGASAPAEELYIKFGITAEGVIKAAKDLL
ncbi:transketolase [Amylibacter sp.]|nr:transketolase [Amylibacter sp.]MDB4130297.1 transketolase [Amylibacter sp.]